MRILQHNSERTAQIRLLNLVHIDAVVADLSVLDIIKAVNQIGNGCFTRSRGTHKGDLLPRLRIKLHIMEHHLIIIIPEIHAVENHISFKFHIIYGMVRLMFVSPCPAACALRRLHKGAILLFHIDQCHITVVRLRRLIQHFKDALRTRHRHDNRVELLAHLVYGHVKASVEGQKTRQFTKG